jgi:hypothetical protein
LIDTFKDPTFNPSCPTAYIFVTKFISYGNEIIIMFVPFGENFRFLLKGR